MFLGEVNLPYPDMAEFFGSGDADELSMQFDFIGMQATYLSLARGRRTAAGEGPAGPARIDPGSQWANFLRNHDELTLDKLSRAERQEVFDAFGAETRTCSSSTAGCGAGCRPCSAATSGASGWPTR